MLASAIRDLKALEPRRYEGRVTALEGLRIEAAGPAQALRLGASVRFVDEAGPRGELVGFEGDRAILLAGTAHTPCGSGRSSLPACWRRAGQRPMSGRAA